MTCFGKLADNIGIYYGHEPNVHTTVPPLAVAPKVVVATEEDVNASLMGVSVDVAVVCIQPIIAVDVAAFVVVTVSVPASVRAPAELNEDVAEPPK